MGRREEKAAQSHAAILVSARREFLANGFESASLRRIAADAGLATGTLFNYARDKVDLLRQVLHSDLEACLAVAVAVPEEGPVASQLVAMARVLLERFAAEPALYRVLLKESLFATGPDGDAFKAQATEFAAEAQRRIATAHQRGEVRTAPELATLGFVSAYYFALITCLASDPADLEPALHLLGLQLDPALGVTP